MKMRQWLVVIVALALLIWLTIPAARIWQDPSLLRHEHTITHPDPMKRLEMVSTSLTPPKTTRITSRIIRVEHRAPFWDRYRSMLFGFGWPPSDRCEDWQLFRGQIRPEGESTKLVVDQEIEADHLSIEE